MVRGKLILTNSRLDYTPRKQPSHIYLRVFVRDYRYANDGEDDYNDCERQDAYESQFLAP